MFASRPGSLLDVSTAMGDSGGVSSASGGRPTPGTGTVPLAAAPRDTGNVAASRAARRGSGGTSMLSDFALFALSANGGTERAGGGGGGAAGGGVSSGGRAAALAQHQHPHQDPHHHPHQHYHHQQYQQHYDGVPQLLSPAVRGGAPPGSVLSSFASPGTASWRWVVVFVAIVGSVVEERCRIVEESRGVAI